MWVRLVGAIDLAGEGWRLPVPARAVRGGRGRPASAAPAREGSRGGGGGRPGGRGRGLPLFLGEGWMKRGSAGCSRWGVRREGDVGHGVVPPAPLGQGGLRGRCRLRLASWDLIGAVGDTSPVSNKGIGFY